MADHPLDNTDRRLLKLLQEHARLPNVELAEWAGLTTSTCHRRLSALEQAGLVRRYAAVLDREKLGFNLVVFLEVALARKDPEATRAFQAAIANRPEVLECHVMTGEYDYLLRIVVPDIAAYRQFVMEDLLSMPGVDKTRSAISLGEVMYSTALPL